jgi:hypothetical protein
MKCNIQACNKVSLFVSNGNGAKPTLNILVARMALYDFPRGNRNSHSFDFHAAEKFEKALGTNEQGTMVYKKLPYLILVAEVIYPYVQVARC